MKKSISAIISIYLLFVSVAFAQIQLEWASNNKFGPYVYDNQGNYYTTGSFQQTQDFDPGPGVLNYTSNGAYDCYIGKYSAQGDLIWCKHFGGTGRDVIRGLALDHNNNVCVTGFFTETVDFDPGPNVYNLTCLSSSFGFIGDAFVLKLDSNGNFEWAGSNSSTTGHNEGKGIATDLLGNVYITGDFAYTTDFDPGPNVLNLAPYANSNRDYYIQKLDPNGNLLWAKGIGGSGSDYGQFVVTDSSNNVYIVGNYNDSIDFDPGIGVHTLGTNGVKDYFIQKLDPSGNLLWAKGFGGPSNLDNLFAIKIANNSDIYLAGLFGDSIDFDPGPGVRMLQSPSSSAEIFLQKLDSSGNFIWANSIGGLAGEQPPFLALDNSGDLYLTTSSTATLDCDPSAASYNLPAGGVLVKLDAACNFIWAYSNPRGWTTFDRFNNLYLTSTYNMNLDYDPSDDILHLPSPTNNGVIVQKFKQKGVFGKVYNDFNQDCIKDTTEGGLANKRVVIMPINIVVETNSSGIWAVDSLPTGTYTVIADTNAYWLPSCPLSQTFTVVHPDSITQAPNFGFYSTNPCPLPDVSIQAPFLRPGFSNQRVYVQVCNHSFSTGELNATNVIVTLDSFLTPQTASTSYVSLGNDQYEFLIDTIFPGFCTSLWMDCNLSTSAVIGQSLCMKAEISPVNSCYLDTIPALPVSGISPCQTAYDNSYLEINSWCHNDTISFNIQNIGSNMSCYRQTRLYVDGILTIIDSILLGGNSSQVFSYLGDGRTWRMEVDQHPFYPGNSQPSTTLERCGNLMNWTPNLVNILPHNDADPHVDIFCGLVTGSYDPNDKTGFPLGANSTNDILPNQDIEYLIRFQNTGTDTAFTVVIRDTLPTDLDIFSVETRVASHDFNFRMYGSRVLEWTFNHIMLPDSNINESASHGFVTFKVRQNDNLPLGTVIANNAAIYFDYNSPIITNTYLHTIASPQVLNWTNIDSISRTACDSFLFHDMNYNTSGSYLLLTSNNGIDSLYNIDLTILNSSTGPTLNEVSCNTYTAPNGQVYTSSGQYTALLSNANGCDSLVTINLTINDSSLTILNEVSCTTYTAPNGQVYTSSGQYTSILSNAKGCDSTTLLNLTIDSIPSDSVSINGYTLFAESSMGSYQWINCDNGNTPIINATNRLFTPLANGNYALEITNGTCTIVSDCISVVGLMDAKLNVDLEINVFPNPTTGILNIENNNNQELVIILTDNLGRKIRVTTTKEATKKMFLNNLPQGVYYLNLNNGQIVNNYKIIKK